MYTQLSMMIACYHFLLGDTVFFISIFLTVLKASVGFDSCISQYWRLSSSHSRMKARWLWGLTMRRSTMRGSSMWLTFCLISCRRYSFIFIVMLCPLLLAGHLQLNMIRNLSRTALPLLRPPHPLPLQLSHPHQHPHAPLPSKPAWLGFMPAQSYRNVFGFSDQKENGDKKDEEAKRKKQEEEKRKEDEQKGKPAQTSWKQRVQDFVNNFWQKADPKDPSKKPPSKGIQLAKKFELVVQYLLAQLKTVYQRRFRVSTLALWAVGLYCVYKLVRYQTELSPQAFIQLLKMSSFEEVEFVEEEYFRNKEIRRKKVTGRIGKQRYYCEVLSFEEILTQVVNDGHVKYRNVRRTGVEVLLNQLYNVLDLFLIAFIIATIVRAPKGAMGQQGSAQEKKKFDIIKNVTVKFADVAGLHESKREVQEVVDFLKRPEKYHVLGATIPKGVLLTGPPGTGKTLLAKACAGEAGVPFFSVSGSDFVEVFVGVGASRVRDLFHQAKESAPSIIFIDELDAVGKKRQNKMGSNDERESTLNQLLVEMDGFGTNSSVIVLAATNRKEILDNALVRAGRFDREVQVGLPDLRGRFEILLVHLSPLKLSPKFTKEEYAKRIAALTPGFSGAELANLCNEAAILAARCAKEVVEMMDFELSSERVIGGVERKGFVSMREKRTVAFHESGHAVVSWFLEGADPLLKVTIIPRSKGALGFAQYFLNENQLQSREELVDRICFILGGRCAEQHFFKEVTTGAYDDLEKAYNLAFALVTKFGMDSQLGYIAYPDAQYTKPYGQHVEATIDREIKKIIDECTVRTKAMVAAHEHHIKNLAEELLIRETLDVRNIQAILGQRPFPINKTFQAYLETEQTL